MKVPHYAEVRIKRWRLLPKVKVGFLFDMYAWHSIYIEKGKQIQDLTNGTDVIYTMMYYAAVSTCRERLKKIWFSEISLTKKLKRINVSEYERLQKVFLESFRDAQETIKEQTAAQAEKKK